MTNQPLHDPWLIAAWPGIGSVAAATAAYLVQSLGAEPAGSIPQRDYFSVDHVDVRQGVARSGRLPRNLFFVWRDPARRHDLIFFIGEAQPARNGYRLCHRIMDFALERGATRVVTFAAMATRMHPTTTPRVFGAVTDPELLPEARDLGIELLEEGRIGGLNGALLAAAAERGVAGVALLGEIPFFAAQVANPKSSIEVLEAFSRMSDIDVETSPLVHAAEATEIKLLKLLQQLEASGQATIEEETTETDVSDEAVETDEIQPQDRIHIEDLFEAARRDRERTNELKAELDRLGVFDQYEDRFLDLFRNAG